MDMCLIVMIEWIKLISSDVSHKSSDSFREQLKVGGNVDLCDKALRLTHQQQPEEETDPLGDVNT